MELRIAGLEIDSICDGPGIRLVVFSQGCPHNCKGCHNPQTHDFNGGKMIAIKEIMEMIKEDPLLDGVTFSGGEPFCQPNAFAQLAKEIKGYNQKLSIMVYTGYTYEKLLTMPNVQEMLEYIDILVDGPFELEKRDISLRFKGSSNQRIIDVQKSKKNGEIVLANI